ncbi:probable WRKY transcription factor 54 [Rutidosis leptorrhynchoides]|uniref:probable WRKY transcription factor 54 n=1 Tax=Rutidosis leptorrhynchoides TaxID=125765 RepID=UPI003A9974C2
MEKTITSNKKRLIGELIRGRDCTRKLQNLLRQRMVNDDSSSTNDLVMNILGSFSNSLLELSSWGSDPVIGSGAVRLNVRALDLKESEKKPLPVVKERRGCYKRRKTEDSRIIIVETMEDGYSWRKYGQKEILDTKFPRCYFRCSYKSEGCKALKQVQKMDDGSELFQITYFGFHTCQSMHKNTQMFSSTGDLNSFLLNFEDSKIKESPSSLSTITNTHFTPSMKQEDDSNAQSCDHTVSSNHDTSSTPLWNDINVDSLEPSHGDSFVSGVSADDFGFDESVFLQV